MRHQFAALGKDLHQTAREEIELVAVVDETKQRAVATGISRDTGVFQDLVVSPAHTLCRFQLLEIGQRIDLVELLLSVAVDEGEAQAFQTAKQRDRDGNEGGFECAGGTHPEYIDGLSLAQLLLQAVLVEVEFDLLDAKRLSGMCQRQFQQFELIFLVEIVDWSAGNLDREGLCLCQQRQTQAQSEEPFHSLLSCRIRDLPGV